MQVLYRNFREQITVKRTTGHTDAGDPVRSSSFTCRARIERAEMEQGDLEGRAVDDQSRLFTDTEIQQGDLVFFPEDNPADDDTGHRVIRVERAIRINGRVHMWTVYM